MSYDKDEMSRRAHEPCELCGKPATEWHHCLVHRLQGHPELHRIYNLQHLCHDCHVHANGYSNRRVFWAKQVERYGDDFLDWWDGLELKVKENYGDTKPDSGI